MINLLCADITARKLKDLVDSEPVIVEGKPLDVNINDNVDLIPKGELLRTFSVIPKLTFDHLVTEVFLHVQRQPGLFREMMLNCVEVKHNGPCGYYVTYRFIGD